MRIWALSDPHDGDRDNLRNCGNSFHAENGWSRNSTSLCLILMVHWQIASKLSAICCPIFVVMRCEYEACRRKEGSSVWATGMFTDIRKYSVMAEECEWCEFWIVFCSKEFVFRLRNRSIRECEATGELTLTNLTPKWNQAWKYSAHEWFKTEQYYLSNLIKGFMDR